MMNKIVEYLLVFGSIVCAAMYARLRISALIVIGFTSLNVFAEQTDAQNKHLGVATCASSVCHGSPIERGKSNIVQNEYIIWQTEDRHAKAYQVLLNDRSKQIAKNLGLEAAHKAKVCLDCHTDNVAKELRGKEFLLSDGVGCESCHGGAEKWIESHASGNHKQSLQQGLTAIDKTQTKADLCLSCHFGNAEKFATHDIMGAGHPRLRFELETYGALQPYHYVIDQDYQERKNPDSGAKIWAIGQVAMANSLLSALQTPKFIDKGLMPELALFDCHACHTSMNANKWQPRSTSKGLGPGQIRLNDSAFVMLGFFAQQLMPETDQTILRQVRALHLATAKDKNSMMAAAANLQTSVKKLLTKLSGSGFNQQSLKSIRKNILSQGKNGEFSDYLSAEQAAMAIDLLSRRISQKQYDLLSAQLDLLFDAIANENNFKAASFVNAMAALENSL